MLLVVLLVLLGLVFTRKLNWPLIRHTYLQASYSIYYIGVVTLLMSKTDKRDNDSHIYLYGLTVLSVLLQSFYQTEVERLNIISSLNPFELLYINAINTAPLLLALSVSYTHLTLPTNREV